jgi:hypothetical protein
LDDIMGTADDDLRLSPGSVAIDAADNIALPNDLLDLDGDANTDEPLSFDLDGNRRFLDDPFSDDTGNPGLGLSLVDMGALEFVSDCNENMVPDCEDVVNATSPDCNGNGVPDECEISKNTQKKGVIFYCTDKCDPDCDENGIPDACDVRDCAGDAECEDCNLNGKPDKCDVPMSSGCMTGICIEECSRDDDEDCVPDECSFWEKKPMNDSWNNPKNWDPIGVPDNIADDFFSVIISGGQASVVLDTDRDAEIDSLQVLDGARLNVTQSNLTIETDSGVLLIDGCIAVNMGFSIDSVAGGFVFERNTADAENVGGCLPPGLTLSNTATAVAAFMDLFDGSFINVADQAHIDLQGALTMVAGTYRKDPMSNGMTEARFEADSVLITNDSDGHGEMILQDSMMTETTGDFVLIPATECFDDETMLIGGCLPPALHLLDSAELIVGGDLIIHDGARLIIGRANRVAGENALPGGPATEPSVGVMGNFDIRSRNPNGFSWNGGTLTLNGRNAGTQAFEVAGLDLGAVPEGLDGNFSMGTVEISDGGDVMFVNAVPNTVGDGACEEALYADTFIVGSDAVATLDNCRIFVRTTVVDNGTVNRVGCGALVPICGGDFDGDCVVDLSDFAVFKCCADDPSQCRDPAACFHGDIDGDGDVDFVDFGAFQLNFDGP